MIILKKGVKALGNKPEMNLALMIVEGVYSKYDTDVVVTSIVDSKHSATSRHYIGMAVDIRTHNIYKNRLDEVFKLRQKHLGDNYFVYLQSRGTPNEHFHISFKPHYSE